MITIKDHRLDGTTCTLVSVMEQSRINDTVQQYSTVQGHSSHGKPTIRTGVYGIVLLFRQCSDSERNEECHVSASVRIRCFAVVCLMKDTVQEYWLVLLIKTSSTNNMVRTQFSVQLF